MKLSLLADARIDAFDAIDSFNMLATGLGDEFEDELFRIKKQSGTFCSERGRLPYGSTETFSGGCFVQIARRTNIRCPYPGEWS